MSGYRVRKARAIDIGYKRGRLSTTTPALKVTDAYRAGAEKLGWTFGEGNRREFCPVCDHSLAWCECIPTADPDRAVPGEQRTIHG